MAQFIKKVATTPVRGNGFIINSWNTNDNKELNAPSMAIVEERADNNLLFNSDFSLVNDGGRRSLYGWTFDEGEHPISQDRNYGALIWLVNTPAETAIISDYILPYWINNNNIGKYVDINELMFPICVSIGYKLFPAGGTLGELQTSEVVINSKTDTEKKILATIDTDINFYVQLTTDGRLRFGIDNNIGLNRFLLLYAKAEKGTKSTAFVRSMRNQNIGALTKSAFKVVDDNITIPSGSDGNALYTLSLNTEDYEGYTPLGLVGVYFSSSTVKLYGFKVEDRSAYIYVGVSGGGFIDLNIKIQVLCVKN